MKNYLKIPVGYFYKKILKVKQFRLQLHSSNI